MHSERQRGKKKPEKTKKKEEERSKQTDENATLSSSRDEAALKPQRKKKKRKISGEEREERSNGVTACAEPVCEPKKKAKNVSLLPCKLKEHNQLQEDGSHHAHVDRNASLDWSKQVRKKVRFSDQFATSKCRQSLSEGFCSLKNGNFEEALASNTAEAAKFTVSCSCNKDNIEEEPTQAKSMNSNAGQVRKGIDEKSFSTRKTQKDEDDEIWGKRFTPEEDELLKNATLDYIKSKGWDEQEGLNKVFNSKKHKDARNCWADIKLALPHRPRQAIRYRAHLLLEKGAHAGKWSEEEEQLLRRLHGEHGRKWKEISALFNRHRTSIKEKWRSLKRMKAKGGWTQGELQQLSDLVHKCLRAKALSLVDKKESDRHILRDDINWEKIADTIGTHNHGSCCGKWYYNLQSSLVTEGVWANEDDLLLLESLLESGACAEEEVEWDSLLNHRSGHVCVTRWKQMVKQLGDNRTRQFLNKLDILARRYAPELLESSVQEMSIETSSVKENPSTTGTKVNDAS